MTIPRKGPEKASVKGSLHSILPKKKLKDPTDRTKSRKKMH